MKRKEPQPAGGSKETHSTRIREHSTRRKITAAYGSRQRERQGRKFLYDRVRKIIDRALGKLAP